MGTEQKLARRPVDQSKQEAILAAARKEFFEQGYAAASIERIAAMANVSKVTIYNHYQGKENLFSAVVDSECLRMRGELHDLPGSQSDLRTELLSFAYAMMNFLGSPDIIRFDRRMAAEVERYPEMGELFLNAGPRQMQVLIADMISKAMLDGHLQKTDPKTAAAHLYGIIKGFADIEWRFAKDANTVVGSSQIEASVDRFLRAYAP
ncbi:MAG: TetR/AcrR family transcriptional regulator [Sphingorhabdus sp.]